LVRYSTRSRPGNLWHRGARADIDEDPLGVQDFRADLDLSRRDEARMALVDAAIFEALEGPLDARVGEADDIVLACLDALHVDRDLAPGAEAVLGPAARQMRGIGARDQSLRRRATRVHAGAAEAVALDDGDGLARARQPPRERGSGLSGSDDDRVIVRHSVLLRVL
jgi:hypothetical protein